jgi:GAF domain-containing protein
MGVLNADYGPKFDRLTTVACKIFHTTMGLKTIADLDRLYCLSSRGLDFAPIRKSPFCCHAITMDDSDILVALDAARDDRFFNDPQVLGYPHIRFYAGAPLVVDGYRLGT